MLKHSEPRYRIWVKGPPRSLQKNRLERYRATIAEAARAIVPEPMLSNRIDIDIWFSAKRSVRADVDNIAKPVLDALKGVDYLDDRQVRSVRVLALPRDDAFAIEFAPQEVFRRLLSDEHEFVINVHEGLMFPAART